MALDQGILDQLLNNYAGSELGDQIQMAKFRQAQGQPTSPVATQPVTMSRGDGTPAVNKGVQVASADNTAGGSMEEFIGKHMEEQPPTPQRKPATPASSSAPTPQRKPQAPQAAQQAKFPAMAGPLAPPNQSGSQMQSPSIIGALLRRIMQSQRSVGPLAQ